MQNVVIILFVTDVQMMLICGFRLYSFINMKYELGWSIVLQNSKSATYLPSQRKS